jgi:hypothetical protein
MAIYKPSGGGLPRTSSGSTTFTVGAQGQPVAWSATNNRHYPRQSGNAQYNKRNAAFTSLDALIAYLDQRYKGLSNKAAWETYYSNIEGDFYMCNNCYTDTSSQKLYRQVNLNLYLMGLAFNDSPAGLTYAEPGSGGSVNFNTANVPPRLSVGGLIKGTQEIVYIIQKGQLLSNPIFYTVGLTGSVYYYAGSYAYDFWIPYYGGPAQQACTCLPNGSPGFTVLIEMEGN